MNFKDEEINDAIKKSAKELMLYDLEPKKIKEWSGGFTCQFCRTCECCKSKSKWTKFIESKIDELKIEEVKYLHLRPRNFVIKEFLIMFFGDLGRNKDLTPIDFLQRYYEWCDLEYYFKDEQQTMVHTDKLLAELIMNKLIGE